MCLDFQIKAKEKRGKKIIYRLRECVFSHSNVPNLSKLSYRIHLREKLPSHTDQSCVKILAPSCDNFLPSFRKWPIDWESWLQAPLFFAVNQSHSHSLYFRWSGNLGVGCSQQRSSADRGWKAERLIWLIVIPSFVASKTISWPACRLTRQHRNRNRKWCTP